MNSDACVACPTLKLANIVADQAVYLYRFAGPSARLGGGVGWGSGGDARLGGGGVGEWGSARLKGRGAAEGIPNSY